MKLPADPAAGKPNMIRIGPKRRRAFIEFPIAFFVVFSLIIGLPQVINYHVTWMAEPTSLEQLIRFLWAIPIGSFLGGSLCALLTKETK